MKSMLRFFFVSVSLGMIGAGAVASPPSALQAPQPVNITGTVTDEKGQPLPGVNVTVKGTSKGAVTNDKGVYSVSVPTKDAVLVFSFIGFHRQEITAGSQAVINVKLVASESELGPVVVIGYGEVRKKDLTGSVGQVNMNDLKKAPVVSFDQALAGRVAGVQAASTDGQPGSSINITIRGANSLTQDNSPLYVVDGFPIENNDNNAINPADIESIDVLKDASATAIYGARGANGVIMITTRKGRTGAPVVSYNGYMGFQKNIKRMDVMKPYDFVKLQLEINNDNATAVYLTGPNKTLEDYRNEKGTDWYKKVVRTAGMQNHSISVGGGTGKSKYFISGSHVNQDGIFINTGFKRSQARISLDQEVNDRFKVGVNANYSDTRDYGVIATSNGGVTTSSLMYSIWAYRPVLPDVNGDIDFEEELFDPGVNQLSDYRTNPSVQLKNELREKISQSLLANGFAEYNFTPSLKLRVTGGMSRTALQNNAFNNSKTRTGSPDYPQSLGVNGSQIFLNTTNFTNENTLTYSKTFNKVHRLNALGGYTRQTGKVASFGAAAVQISNETLGLSGLDEGTPRTITATSSSWALQSFLARVDYAYRSRYLLTVSMRADGSSKFASDNRWGYFPSAAFAYRISEENFMKELPWISDTKVRLSYGMIGNNRVGDFSYLSGINTANSTGYSFGSAGPYRGTYAGTLGNAFLKWETTREFDAGIDLGFWNDRLTLTADYYYKKTTDLLLSADLPGATGYDKAQMNIGAVSNRGFELLVNSVNVASPKFKWSSSFNIAFNRNKVLALSHNQQARTSTTSAIFNSNPVFIAKIGQPIAQFYGVIFEGLYRYADFDQLANGTYVLQEGIPANGGNRSAIRPGDARYRDINYDGQINLGDYTVIGDPNPDFTGGFNNNFEYKGFDLNIFFQFSYGNDVLNANRSVFENVTPVIGANINKYTSYLNRWTPENTETNIPRVNGHGADFYSSRIVEDGSFLRLKTISLGYNISPSLLRHIRLKAVRVYGSAQNLYTWTKYSGVDPEVSTRHSTLTPGFDYSPYPRAMTAVFGLNVTF